MRVERCGAPAAVVAGLVVLAGCGEAAVAPDPAASARQAAPDDPAPSIVLDQGMLRVRGDHGDNAIRIEYTWEGVRVWLDGIETWIREPVVAIEVDAGDGENDVAYHQRAAADMELQIETGAGDDRVRVALEPAPGPHALPFRSVGVRVDAGAGSDHVDIRWNGTALPASNYYLKLEVERDPFVPDVGDEVVVGFEHGDPDRPVILGAFWNGAGRGAGPTGEARNVLSLGAELAPSGGRIDLGIDGGAALEERVRVHADLQGGHHSMSSYIVTSARHAHVESTIAGDDGNHELDLTFARRGAPARGGVADELAVSVDAGDGGSPLTYYQDRMATESHLARVGVRLLGGTGGDNLTALLDGITGDGAFQFRAHGAAGNDRIHVQARHLRPGPHGQLLLEVLGGEGNDVLSLMLPADLDRAAAVAGWIDGGEGRNICRATATVQVVRCREVPTGS